MASETGGTLLVNLLRQLETDVAFGVVSVHNLPLVDALANDLRWVPTRGEAGAVNAADGWSRVSGRIGCAVTSTGTGAGNAAGSLVEALTAGTPLLHITGQIEREHLGRGKGVIHETRDQLAMLQAISRVATTVSAHGPAADFERCLAAIASAPSGPASLEWPIDDQFRTPDRWVSPPEPVPDGTIDGDLDQASALIAQAARPLVWAGGGGRHNDAVLSEFVDRIGASLLTSNAGRGSLPESDDRVIGNFASSTTGADLLAECDLLISFGTHFRSNETRSYNLQLPENHVQVDIDPAAIGRSYPCSLGLVGDSGVVLAALLENITEAPDRSDWRQRCQQAATEARETLRADIGPYAPLAATLNDVLDPSSPRVRDITIPNSSWGNRLLEITDARTNVYPRGGGIGQALGLALGASVARPTVPTLAIIGDGGLQVQLGELATISQEQAPVIIVVFDDGGYGVLRNMQDQHLGRRSGVDLYTPSIPALAEAHDIPCLAAGSAEAFEASLRTATETHGPTMLHVDCAKLGPMPKPFSPPVHLPETS